LAAAGPWITAAVAVRGLGLVALPVFERNSGCGSNKRSYFGACRRARKDAAFH